MLSWLRSALLDNLSLKLFALLLAIILFRKVNQEDLVRVATVDVKLLYAFPKDLLMTSEPVTSIKVTLQGPESKLKSVATRVWRFTVRLSDAAPGPMQAELYTQEIRSIFPGDIQVTRIKPSILNVQFAKRAKRTISIKVDLKGKPPFGYTLLKPIHPYPRQIVVEGPEKEINKLSHIDTQTIDLTGKTSDSTHTVKLKVPARHVRFLGPNAVKVMLQFNIEKGKKKFEDIPIKMLNFLNTKLDFELHPNRVTISTLGPISQLHLLKKKDVIAEVDGTKIATQPPGEYKVTLRIRQPGPDIKVLKSEPPSVTVRTFTKEDKEPTRKPPTKRKKTKKKPTKRIKKAKRRKLRRKRRHKHRRKRKKPIKRRKRAKKRKRTKKRRLHRQKKYAKRHHKKKRRVASKGHTTPHPVPARRRPPSRRGLLRAIGQLKQLPTAKLPSIRRLLKRPKRNKRTPPSKKAASANIQQNNTKPKK